MPSGRAHQFRPANGWVEQLQPDGTWAPYVPFARLLAAAAAERAEKEEATMSWSQGIQTARGRIPRSHRPSGEGFALANRLAELSKRQMDRYRASPPAPAPAPKEKEPMHAASETNGVSKHRGRTASRPEAERRELAEGFRAADDAQAYCERVGVHRSTIAKWAAELLGPGPRGPRRKAGETRSEPAKPDKTQLPPPPAARPAPPVPTVSSRCSASCWSCPRTPASGSWRT